MSELRAGAATVSVAPRASDLRAGVWLGGFGSYRARRATGIHDEPYCRALALSDGDSAFVLAALDLVGATGPLLETIRADAARLTGLAEERILLTCTHSHASPDTQDLWGGVPNAYRTHVAHRAGSAIYEAQRAMRPVRALAASRAFAGMVRNRRGWPETDTALTAVRFAPDDGSTVATLVNYACHPTASGRENTEVSRDWCGYTVDAVERELGGTAIYVNGAIGDVNPAESGGLDAAERLGEAVAQAAIDALRSEEDVTGALSLRSEPLEIAVNIERLSERVSGAIGRAGFAIAALSKAGGMRAAARALHAAGRADLAQAAMAVAGMSERRLIPRDGRTYLRTRCAHLRIGGVEGMAAPGEVLTRLALPLRGSLGGRHRLFLGLAHDTLGYFVPEDEWMTGRNNNYEESVSLGRRAGSTLADRLLSIIPHAQEAT